MKYFFILGTNTALSIAEIFSFFDNIISYKLLNQDVLLVEFENEINAKEIIKKLGGTIKIGEIFDEVKGNVEYDDVGHLFDIKKGEKYKFGISCYTRFKKINPKFLAMEIKKSLSKGKSSVRWVTSKEKTLSSVVVEQNKLTSKGIELILIENKKNILIGKTLAVQAFKDLSFRDYNRPARDDKSGMLPPKLAQIMINLSQKNINQDMRLNTCLLDPFCGSGTVLTEAMLMGFNNLIGSDISEKATNDTKKNIEWIQKHYKLSNINYKLYNQDVLNLSEKIEKNSVDIIISEPYLGPQRGSIKFEKVKKELEELYSGAIKEFDKILKNNGKIIMLFPVFRINKQSLQINPNLDNFKIVNIIPENLRKRKEVKQTGRNTIIYGRENQRIWREIVILEKK